jgi:hypothetical protein
MPGGWRVALPKALATKVAAKGLRPPPLAAGGTAKSAFADWVLTSIRAYWRLVHRPGARGLSLVARRLRWCYNPDEGGGMSPMR